MNISVLLPALHQVEILQYFSIKSAYLYFKKYISFIVKFIIKRKEIKNVGSNIKYIFLDSFYSP